MSTQRQALLVEDEPLVAMLVVDLLNELGFQVLEAASGRKAREIAKNGLADIALAVVDLGLPDEPGEKIISEMKTIRPDLPIIVASGSGPGQNPQAFAVYEKLHILPKPYEFKGLRAAIGALGVPLESSGT
ncbi:MAG: response regulator [Pseudolabrys sp.]|nr:response regulator [Pseudolabrys sp.]MBV9955253.1 response regulator [Pseudolabrys sp.]